MTHIFKSVDELFAFSEKQESLVTLQGMIKTGDRVEEVLFTPFACDDWIALEKGWITEVRFLRHVPCLKPGEEPHSHPLVSLSLKIADPRLEAIFKLLVRLLSERRKGRSKLVDDDCQYGYGACGGYNPDTKQDCSPGTRPCFEDGYTWCKEFPECDQNIAGSKMRPFGIQVGGPAGDCTDAWFDGQCYYGKNRCPKKVILHLGPYSTLLNPGEQHRFTGLDGRCFGAYFGATTAEYA
jgi:hypothetical protein